MTPIADQVCWWLCKCGKRPWSHVEYCVCGEARPAPPPEPEGELSDIGRPDAALRPGLRECLQRIAEGRRAAAEPQMQAALEAQMQRADEPEVWR